MSTGELDEALRMVLIEIVQAASSLPVEQRKSIIAELQRMEIKNPDVKEQLRTSFGIDTFEAALRSAASRVAVAEPSVSRERLMPKALGTGGDVGVLCGVDLAKERTLLRSILVARRAELAPGFISSEYVAETFSVASEEISVFLSSAASVLMRKLVLACVSIKRDIQRAIHQGSGDVACVLTQSSIFTQSGMQATSGNLKKLTLTHLLRGLEILDLPASVRERWEARTLAAAQAKVLGSS